MDVSAWPFGDGGLLSEALVKLVDEVLVVLEEFSDAHEGLNGSKGRFILLFPFVEELFKSLVLVTLFNKVDKVLAVAIKLVGGQCHFQSINNQLL